MHVCLTDLAQRAIAARLHPGDASIDATAGNGHDTLFLARRVGENGRVLAFDIQPQALRQARERLRQAGLTARVTWLCLGHEHMDQAVPDAWRPHLRAVMFNLGYLPRGDKRLTTTAATTTAALEKALALLAPGGRISLIAYTGHPGGRQECETVRDWLYRQPADLLSWRTVIPQGRRRPPWLFLIDKR
ncbi:hypothetical protein MIT9_P1381 [Methylomarinovum caldicuralii]|uniref:rRNA methylase n=1 Tax=Methylomarinovum caldicuralii TaxID=438856 RepID=A0AAU9C8L5_9GAMM|nr:class I SAM-dependent methyltransferase [Methylomarinovum caldicuralii]BCX81801.1 hypothetical protein MIT9_P1381 [Methylomarinovum caldicuralii]